MSDHLEELDLGGDADDTLALKLVAGGAVALLLGWLLDSGLLRFAGFVAALAGGGMFARRMLAERGQQIDAAESNIRSELDGLDPVARAQVLADLAQSES